MCGHPRYERSPVPNDQVLRQTVYKVYVILIIGLDIACPLDHMEAGHIIIKSLLSHIMIYNGTW